jgi:hypothetical protein
MCHKFEYINLTTVYACPPSRLHGSNANVPCRLDRFLHSILACRAILHIRHEHKQSQLFPVHLKHWDNMKFATPSQAEDLSLGPWDHQIPDQGSSYDGSAVSQGQSNETNV